jgi:hypothetical protein
MFGPGGEGGDSSSVARQGSKNSMLQSLAKSASALKYIKLCICANIVYEVKEGTFLILHHIALFHMTVQHMVGHNLMLKHVLGVALRGSLLTILKIP